jgi:hypothetical protein
VELTDLNDIDTNGGGESKKKKKKVMMVRRGGRGVEWSAHW